MGIHGKLDFLGGLTKIQYIVRLPKKGSFGQFTDLRGGLIKKEELVSLRGVDIPMHTMEGVSFLNINAFCSNFDAVDLKTFLDYFGIFT